MQHDLSLFLSMSNTARFVGRLPVKSWLRVMALQLTSLSLAFSTQLAAQSCLNTADESDLAGSIACPDGAASVVMPAGVAAVATSDSVELPDQPLNPDGSAAIDAPAEAGSGSQMFVAWTGPANQGDYIAIAEPGSTGNEYRNYTYVQQGSPLSLTAPDEAGNYEVRYIQNQSRAILASVPVRVTASSATLAAAGTVNSGSSFAVSWTGPNNPSDYIAIAEPGTTGNEYRNYTYVQEGSPLMLTAPDEAGAYEIRYIQHQSRTILASVPLRVMPASATLAAAGTVNSGSSFAVSWTGPNNPSDYIAIAEPGTTGNEYRNYTYVQEGSPLTLIAPDEPGRYEVRYIQRQSRTILVALPIDVLPVNATLQVTATARAGDRFDVAWTGPANASDYIAIGTIGGSGSEYENYAYVQQGSPLQLAAPAQAGTYEVRYVQRQSRTVLARQAIRVTD